MPGNREISPAAGGRARRPERLAEELRANLARRKAQARARRLTGKANHEPTEPAHEGDAGTEACGKD